jgi:hypothetical protein
MLPSTEDILEYFGGMTPKERSEEYDLLSLDEQKYFDSLLQMSRL